MEWQPHFTFSDVIDESGNRIVGPCPVMRRRVTDDWQYRKMTEREESEFMRDDAW